MPNGLIERFRIFITVPKHQNIARNICFALVQRSNTRVASVNFSNVSHANQRALKNYFYFDQSSDIQFFLVDVAVFSKFSNRNNTFSGDPGRQKTKLR